MEDPIGEIYIRPSDIEHYLDFRTLQKLRGAEVTATLGSSGEEIKAALMQVLPKIITDKLKELIPSDFILAEVGLTLKVAGNLGFASLNGDISLKLKPK